MVRKGKGTHEGVEGYRQPVGTCQPVRQLPGCSKSTFASVDWRHIFGRDNAAKLIFLSPVSISRNWRWLTRAATATRLAY